MTGERRESPASLKNGLHQRTDFGHGSNEREVHLKSLLTSTFSNHQHQSSALFPHIPVMGEKLVPLLSLRPDHCRWPSQVDEGTIGGVRFCAAPVASGQRYCSRHIARSRPGDPKTKGKR